MKDILGNFWEWFSDIEWALFFAIFVAAGVGWLIYLEDERRNAVPDAKDRAEILRCVEAGGFPVTLPGGKFTGTCKMYQPSETE